MTPGERHLCRSGLLLFLAGLVLGLLVHALPNARAALVAHLNGVQSGTALLAFGLLWGRGAPGRRWTRALPAALSVAFWALQAGITAAAWVPASAAPAHPWTARVAGVLRALGALLMLVAVALTAALLPGARGGDASAEAT